MDSTTEQPPENGLDTTQLITTFQDFFEKKYYTHIAEAARQGAKTCSVNFPDLAEYNPTIADQLLDEPEEILKAAELSIAQLETTSNTKGFTIRFHNLPPSSTHLIRNVRSKHLKKFICIEGIVRNKGDVRPQVITARFECPSCGNTLNILQVDTKFQEPTRCSCGRKGKFRLLSKELIDAQGLVLEEVPEQLEGGAQPKRLNIFLKNDLVSPLTEKKTNPGSRIILTGIVKEVPKITKQGTQSTTFDIIFEANHVQPAQQDFSDIKISKEEEQKINELSQDPKLLKTMTQAIAPSIYGHYKIKESLVLQLIGGVKKSRDDGITTRGDIHILLVGDPGSGKCLTGTSKIPTADGSIYSIKNLASHAAINTLNYQGKIVTQKPTRFWKRKAPTTVTKISLASGRTITVTKEHPLFTTEKGYVFAKPAREYKQGEYLATARRIQYTGKIQRLPTQFDRSHSKNQQPLTFPKTLTREMARLLGYLIGDGYVQRSPTSGWIRFTNNNLELITDFKKLIKKLFNGTTTIRSRKTSSEAYLCSRTVLHFLNAIDQGIATLSNTKAFPQIINRSPTTVLKEFIRALFECETHINQKKKQLEFTTISKNLAEDLHLNLLKFGIISLFKTKKKYAANTALKRKVTAYEIIISGEQTEQYLTNIGFISKNKKQQAKRLLHARRQTISNTNIDIIPNLKTALRTIRTTRNLYQKEMGIARPTYSHYEQGDRNPSRTSLQKIVSTLRQKEPANHSLAFLEHVAHADIFWDKILKIKQVKLSDPYVYDLQIDNNHNFVANGVIVHNSQLLKRISHVAPRGRFISGKGVSGAGLTASVVKDEFLGGFSLEAGALVLANHGVCAIDELDKMSKDDTAAMHEALEGQTITISKANVQATLRCETTVLAAANPKFGRFDPFEPIAAQITLVPTLINRFDLIFPIKDLPDQKKDEKMASFILNLHKSNQLEEEILPTDFLRKYIAYARQKCSPRLTDESIEEIHDYYLKMRASATGEGVKSIPISARQLEGLVRLSEAHAKLHLQTQVTRQDAKKAVELIDYCLRQVAYDEKTGTIDIDRIATDTTAQARNKIAIIKEAIKNLENKHGKEVPAEKVIELATEKGLTEHEVEETLRKLKQIGDIYEPRHGIISRV